MNPDAVINSYSRFRTRLKLNKRERAAAKLAEYHQSDASPRRVVDNKKLQERKLNPKVRDDGGHYVHQVFTIDDIATETTVLDHLGQKMNLCIENRLGGGGQRHITIYCPYWIVNTTEHALRYRQEKISAYVSGTKVSESQDGSRIVDLKRAVDCKLRTLRE